MNSVFLRWGIPALVTVVAGTAVAVATTGDRIAADLNGRATEALDDGYGWTQVLFDGRDALVTGTAADAETIDDVVARVAAVHGVRSVTSGMVLADYATPYPFSARIAAGRIALSGGVPDEAAHAELVLETAAAEDGLRLLAGAPPRAEWRAAVAYALDYLPHFEEGEVGLADLTLSVSGRAANAGDFDALVRLGRDAPDDVELGFMEIVPPLMAPYEWRAEFDGRTVAVSGYAPGEGFAERLRTADLQGLPLSTSLVLASGAPAKFDETALLLLQNLAQLERGTAIISDSAVTLSGTPGDRATAERVRLTVAQAGATVTLDPPRVTQYFFTAIRRDGEIVLDGLVPDEASLQRLQALPEVDATGLELARGAPRRFASAVDFGLDALGHLSEGRFSIRDNVLALHGRARTLADLAAAETIVALGAPQGLILAKAELRPPLASPYSWSAEKQADGRMRLAGHVPSPAIRTALQEAAAGTALDATTVADGAPADFEAMARSGLAMLPRLATGTVGYDGRDWSLTGAVATAEQALLVEQAFAEAGLESAGWIYDVRLPPPPLPVVDPYEWRATRNADGTVTVAGFAPADAFRKVVAVRVGASMVDDTELGRGQPDGFFEAALAGLDALQLLDEGTLELADGTWRLTGTAATTPQRAEVERSLAAATDSSGWQLAIAALDVPPAAEPYLWRAAKSAEGIVLSGHVTTDEFRRFLAVRAGRVASNDLELASGEPAGFVDDALAALEALRPLSSGTAEYDGDGWRLTGVPATPADAEAALAALATATDAGASWTTSLSEPEPEPVAPSIEAAAPEEPEIAALEQPPLFSGRLRFDAVREPGQDIALRGAVPADAARRYFGVLAGGIAADDLTLADDLPADFAANATAGIRALASLSDGRFGFDGSRWMLAGRAATEEARLAALASAAAAPSARDWQTELTLVPSMELCQQRVASFASRNAILFQSGSATITGSSLPALDELASYLALCPEAAIHVEGHTDTDGEEVTNLALSVARAEAVVAALIDRGVGFERLYAIGYGEALPIADNATGAGKQANRRIAFTIVEGQN